MKKYLDSIKNFIVIPSWLETFILSTFLLLYAIKTSFIVNGDSTYGYAMIEKIVDSGAFAHNDIVINGSLGGNFLFYKLLAYLPLYQNNFPLSDLIISIPITLLMILGLYNIYFFVTKNRYVTVISILFTIIVDGRLSLGGTNLPMFNLTSAASVYYVLIFSLYFFIRGKHWVSVALSCMATYFHPAAGFFFLAVYFCTLLVTAHDRKDLVKLIKLGFIPLIIVLPNIYLLSTNLGSGISSDIFFDTFYRIKGGHAYLGDYFKISYIYTIAVGLLIIVSAKKSNYINSQKKILALFYSSFFLVTVWLINLYTIKNLKIFYLYFAMRSTYIIKPMFVLFIIVIAGSLIKKKYILPKLIAGLLVLSMVVPNAIVGSFFVVLAVLYVIFERYVIILEGKSRFLSLTITPLINRLVSSKKLLYSIGIISFLILSILFLDRYNGKTYKIYRFLKGENLFNFSYNKEDNFGWNKKSPGFGELLDWAGQFKGKMFIVPLLDNDMTGGFRFITKNSIYISIYDMGQLSYCPPYYLEGLGRLKELGFKFIGSRGYDYSAYDSLRIADVNNLDADFIIFDKHSSTYKKQVERPVFESTKYIVYSLR